METTQVNQPLRRIKTATATQISDEVKQLVKDTYKAKAQKNEATRAEAKARKALFKEMKDQGLSKFSTVAVVDGKRITLEAEITQPERIAVDISILKGLVSEEEFLAIVSATQTSVVKHAGEATLRRCSESTKGTENVSVNPIN